MGKTRYEITLPDGGILARTSAKTYTHAIVTQDTHGWRLVTFCTSLALAAKCLADWQDSRPTEPAQIVPTRIIEPLTERQRQFLKEIGDRTIEMFGTSHIVALIKRNLVERRHIGKRWWRVRRTEAGRQAVGAQP